MKGAEPGIDENLDSFFALDYPVFEILFSVADVRDPARAAVARALQRHPGFPARLIVGEVDVGPNPKVNNLMHSYREARHDCLLISDSNVRVRPDYLRKVASYLKPDVGVVTAVVAGTAAAGFGGKLESTFLNSFYARWMHVAFRMGFPFVIGKSMLFRRSVADRFGGVGNLANYIAEDYMAGQAMRHLGLKIVVMHEPVRQHIGRHGFDAFWSRHLRWGRIRKAQSPLAFAFEPLLGAIVSGCLGAIAFRDVMEPRHFLFIHMVVWAVLDGILIRHFEDRWDPLAPFFWLIREILAVPMWIHIACGNSILWRGNRMKISHGGLIL